MKTHLFRISKFGLFFAVALLAWEAGSAAAAASAGSGTVTMGKERPITFSDAYAFRAEDFSDNRKQVTLVIVSEAPLDKKAMTAALRKEREKGAISQYISKAYIRLKVEDDGDIREYYLFVPPGSNVNVSSNKTRSDVKVNTAKRVEGRFFHEDTNVRGELRRIDLRFATDLADIGRPVRN